MEHGFMQSIIKNQVDRDEYDKEQKCLKVQSKISSSSRRERPRRADIQVYVPPHLRQKEALKEKTAASTSSTSTSSKGALKFGLASVLSLLFARFLCYSPRDPKYEVVYGGNSDSKLACLYIKHPLLLELNKIRVRSNY